MATLKARLANLESERDAGKVGICFGSRKLFGEQFALGQNGFASHEEWLAEWRKRRCSQFFAIGSRDETAGCQSCVAAVQEDGSITVRLRLPDALGAGKHLAIERVRFAYGHDAIVAAIGRNLSEDKALWQAISYRFVQDARGWRVFVSIAIPEVAVISHRQAGVIGVDINADRLAVSETDRFGNPVGSWVIDCVTYGSTSERRAAIIGDAVKQVVAIAVARSKPFAIEKLDFAKKRARLEAESRKHARMISAFAYRRIRAVLRARSYDAGIEVLATNPAYSSIIGKYKFASRYGLSAHNAAACVLARRVMGLGERLPSQFQVTPQLLVKNRSGHVWSLWAIISRRDRAAHAAQRRPGGSTTRSPAAPALASTARPVIPPPPAGANPAREPSSALFG
jgi:IS605 OrfB family transposase